MLPSNRLFLVLLVLLVAALSLQAASPSQPAGQTRTYFIAADVVDWNFAPTGIDQIHNVKYDLKDDPGAKGELDPNATTYRKARFREYTDATFTTLKPIPEDWQHLGVLGPLIRAEVGDTIVFVFKNNADRPYSVHPHGVFYNKDSEGAGYEDHTSGRDKADDAVPPGSTYTYTWPVTERSGPAHGDESSVFWLYHSHVNEGKDINSGLVGPMIISGRGQARPDGSPKDVDREFVAQFGMFDEHQSWYWQENIKRLYGDPKNYDDTNHEVHEFHHFFTINGYLDGNGPILTMHKGEHVRWYLFANPNELEAWDIHSAHWHGQTVVVGHMRTDMVMLNPMTSAIADMVPDNPGIWLFHCHMNGHFEGGMRTRFQVLDPVSEKQRP